jgi:TolA-binding protein
MSNLFWTALMALVLAGPATAWSAREINVDFETGKVTESVHEPAADQGEVAPADKELESAAEEIARLKGILRLESRLLRQQQAVIKEQRKKNRRLEDINRSLELMLRACR